MRSTEINFNKRKHICEFSYFSAAAFLRYNIATSHRTPYLFILYRINTEKMFKNLLRCRSAHLYPYTFVYTTQLPQVFTLHNN
jgi:hypothetical protein